MKWPNRSLACDSMIPSSARINEGMHLVWNFAQPMSEAQAARQEAAFARLAEATAAARPAPRTERGA